MLRSKVEKVYQASRQLGVLTTQQRNKTLDQLGRLLRSHSDRLILANKRDLDEQEQYLSSALYQRLKLDPSKLETLIDGCQDLIALPDPIGRELMASELKKGLVLKRVTVPLGVIAVIFESRPDVLPQIISLAIKSGNAVILKPGKETAHTMEAFRDLLQDLGSACSFLPRNWVELIETREEVVQLLTMDDVIDLVIPRGSNELVKEIQGATRIPVLGHADGICHMYVHSAANVAMAVELAVNAKAQYPAACNALETLLVDQAVTPEFWQGFAVAAAQSKIDLRGCERARHMIPDMSVANDEDWRTEYGDLRLAVKVVDHLSEAIEHINDYGSHHTDAIITSDSEVAESFLQLVDSACVFHNVSTRYADGYRFGLGAEVGISTGKLHARGPVGLEGLTTYKYQLRGKGQVVS